MRLVMDALTTTALVAGPLLAAALVAGILVGLAQAVVQVNEASLSFLVKLLAVAVVLVGLGAGLAETMTGYTRRCFADVERVVR
jgi:flagellar biosynthetic protein FliQ